MSKTALLSLTLILAAGLMLAACSQDQNAATTDEGETSAEAMTTCLFAGTGATFGADGERVNFTCGSTEADPMVVLAGEVQIGDDGWMIDQATVTSTDDGWETTAAAMVPVQGIDLDDGTECLSAGTGATFGVDGERVNYTCGTDEAGDEIVLAGEIVIDDEGSWTIKKAAAASSDDGWETKSSEMAVIAGLAVPETE